MTGSARLPWALFVALLAFIVFVALAGCTPPPPPSPLLDIQCATPTGQVDCMWEAWTFKHVAVVEFTASPDAGCDLYLGPADGKYRVALDQACVDSPAWGGPDVSRFVKAHSFGHPAADALGEGLSEAAAQTVATVVTGTCYQLTTVDGGHYPCPTPTETARMRGLMVAAGMVTP